VVHEGLFNQVDFARSTARTVGTQVTVSENHPDWSSHRGLSGGDVGGNFFSQKKYVIGASASGTWTTGWMPWDSFGTEYQATYRGPVYIPAMLDAAFPAANSSSNTELNSYGASAIAKAAPIQPTVSLATSLLEAYHDGIPKLLGKELWEETTKKALDVKKFGGSAGSEYLNLQFGWLPVASDMRDFLHAVTHMGALINQYARDNGKPVRRRFNFPPELSEESTVISSSAVPGGPNLRGDLFDLSGSPKAQVVRDRKISKRRWFSGAFIYHLPKTFFRDLIGDNASDFDRARKVLGLEITPETLWELTPWSWAVDWFTNAGDVIQNVDAWANDGLVLEYGYIMEHSIVRDVFSYIPNNSPTVSGTNVKIVPPSYSVITETKIRQKANPFGFGLTMDGLNNVQKSILAALGLSKLR